MSLVVEQTGMFSTLQDRGRRGLRDLGIPWAGVGCEPWMRFANRLLDQVEDTPVIETFEGGLTLRVKTEPVKISLIGDVLATITHSDSSVTQANAWRTHTLVDGDKLTIKRTGIYRCAVLGVQHLDVTPHYGSASTYLNASLGGLNGGTLQIGDDLPYAEQNAATLGEHKSLQPFQFPGEKNEAADGNLTWTVQAVPGPQDDAFTDTALETFFTHTFTVTADIDRMGARLDGPEIKHRSAKHKDIVSDAILPGSVQVPGIGKPIVMLADAHTVGGYPKIATVTSADRALFALCRPGTKIQFDRVNTIAAREHTLQLEESVQQHLASVSPVVDTHLNTSRLLGLNLIGGVTDALDFDS